MYSLAPFLIDLKSLHEGVTRLTFKVDDAFFEALEDSEIRRGDLDVALSVTRRGDMFELDFHIDGQITIPCDLCLDDMPLDVVSDNRLVAKFGEESAEEDDLVTVSEDEGILDVAWFVYESIVLSIPIRHVHAPGKCNPAMMKVLEGFSATRSGEEDDGHDVDPRWAALAKLNIKE